MTRPTTITLSFLLVLLVIAGMTIKSQMENVPQQIADSLVTKPELISRLPYYAKAIGVVSVSGHRGNEVDTIKNYFPMHSEIPTR